MPETTYPARSDASAPASDAAGASLDTARAERLRRLEERLAAARARRAPPPRADEHYSQANIAWRMVTELVAGLGLGLAVGLGLDAMLGTEPVMLVLFILLGFAAGVRVMMRTAEEVAREGRTAAVTEGARDGDG